MRSYFTHNTRIFCKDNCSNYKDLSLDCEIDIGSKLLRPTSHDYKPLPEEVEDAIGISRALESKNGNNKNSKHILFHWYTMCSVASFRARPWLPPVQPGPSSTVFVVWWIGCKCDANLNVDREYQFSHAVLTFERVRQRKRRAPPGATARGWGAKHWWYSCCYLCWLAEICLSDPSSTYVCTYGRRYTSKSMATRRTHASKRSNKHKEIESKRRTIKPKKNTEWNEN